MQRFTPINQEIFPNLCSRMPQNILIFLENLYKKKSLYSRCFQVNNNMSKGTFLYIKDYSRSRYNNRNIIYSA